MAAAGVAAKLMGSFFSGSEQAAVSQAEANKNTASTLGVYTSALWDAVKIGLIAVPVFYAIKAAASAIGKAFEGAGMRREFSNLGLHCGIIYGAVHFSNFMCQAQQKLKFSVEAYVSLIITHDMRRGFPPLTSNKIKVSVNENLFPRD